MTIKSHLVLEQGATFSVNFNLTDDNGNPLDLTGYNVISQMKRWYTSSNSTSFTTSSSSGVVSIGLDANTTSSILAGRYVYDVYLQETATSTMSRIVEGTITVTPQVTLASNVWVTNSNSNGYWVDANSSSNSTYWL